MKREISLQEETKEGVKIQIANTLPLSIAEEIKDEPKQIDEQQNPMKTSSSAPTKRDGDIEEYQRRKIRLSDFI